MIINGKSIQFNYKMAGYKSIEEVPCWRIYIMKRQRYTQYLPDGTKRKRTRNQIVRRYIINFTMDEIKCITFDVDKGEYVMAYAREYFCTNRIY